MPVFQGSRMQRGYVLGSILSGFFRSAWPLIQTGAKAFGKQVLRTGLKIANDVSEGHNFKEASKRHIPEGIKAFASSYDFNNQGGSGGRRKRRRKSSPKKKKSQRSKSDIFGKI